MPQSERWRSIGREILFSARTELYMGLPLSGRGARRARGRGRGL